MNLIWIHGEWLPILYPVFYVLLMVAWFGICYAVIKFLDRRRK